MVRDKNTEEGKLFHEFTESEIEHLETAYDERVDNLRDRTKLG